jgi:CBS domain-containing protein
MGSHGVGSLLVVDGGALVGIVTDRDIAVRGTGAGMEPAITVQSVMTLDPVTIQGSSDVMTAFAVFRTAGARRLPVLEEDELAGIISVDDLLVSLVAELGAVLSPIAQELARPS